MNTQFFYDKVLANIPARINGVNIPIITFINTTNTMKITFKDRIVAEQFSYCWGSISADLSSESVEVIEISLQDVNYISLFAISKIVLTILELKKPVSIIWPSTNISPNGERHKMLRFLYNRGILDILFATECKQIYNLNNNIEETQLEITNIIDGDVVKDYNEKYDFSECVDRAITKYSVFSFSSGVMEIGQCKNKAIQYVIDKVLEETKGYLHKVKKENLFDDISPRLDLYLYELVSNIFNHAYVGKAGGIFAITINNDYLPEYAKMKRNRSGQNKFLERCKRQEREIPLKIFGDIVSRTFGGMTLFVDDIGCGIGLGELSRGQYTQLYRDIFIEGVNPVRRPKHATSLNGLKLVADQIADHLDTFWCHDNQSWIGSTFTEYRFSTEADLSTWDGIMNPYRVKFITGVTYEIGINFSKSSLEKTNSYQTYGAKIYIDFLDLKHIVESSHATLINSMLLVDRWDLRDQGGSPHWLDKKVNQTNFDYIVIRLREKRKDNLIREILNSILNNTRNIKKFEEMLIYDLDATTLFQFRAVLETASISRQIYKYVSKSVTLISTEGYLFNLRYNVDNNSYKLTKTYSKSYLTNSISRIHNYYFAIFHNDKKHINICISDRKRIDATRPIMYYGEITWGEYILSSYLDIEQMTKYHHIYKLMLFMLMRINGLLSNKYYFIFLEPFMERAFSSHLIDNSVKEKSVVYLGSLMASKRTETSRTRKTDNKIYLFKHNESQAEMDETYLVLLNYPKTHRRKLKEFYRRIPATNRIEKYVTNDFEILPYKGDAYRRMIRNINYHISFSMNKLIQPVTDDKFLFHFAEFVILILQNLLLKYDVLYVKWDIISNFCTDIESSDDNDKNDLERKLINVRTHIESCLSQVINPREHPGKKIEFGKQPSQYDAEVHIKYSIDLMDFLSFMRENASKICISLYSQFEFERGFDRVIAEGYYPFLPIICGNSLYKFGKVDTGKIFELSDFLTTPYKRIISQYLDNKHDNLGNKDFFHEIQLYFNTPNTSTEILYDTIMYDLYNTLQRRHDLANSSKLYKLLINILAITVTSYLQSEDAKQRVTDNIYSQILSIAREGSVDDNIVLFFILVFLYCNDSVPSWTIKDVENYEVVQLLNDCKSSIIRILFTWILRRINQAKYRECIQSVFINSDIAIYHHMLYSQLFNDFGSDHDGPIGRYTKTKSVDAENSESLKNTLDDCLSYFKLTKPYDESPDYIAQAENNVEYMRKLINNKKFTSELHDKVYEFKDLVKKRFITISTDKSMKTWKTSHMDFVKEVISALRINVKLTDGQVDELCENIQLIHHKNLPELQKSVSIIRDPYIMLELASLLNDAIKNSGEIPFSLDDGMDKKAKVWIESQIDASKGSVILKLYNMLSRPFEEVISDISHKRRIGKSHLIRYNILVNYEKSCREGNEIIITLIEIPYLS